MSPVRLGYWLPAITAAQQNEESATRNRRNRHTCRECAWDVYEEHAEMVLKRQKAVKKFTAFLYSDRESNPDLLFRRELFYPLNYQSCLYV